MHVVIKKTVMRQVWPEVWSLTDLKLEKCWFPLSQMRNQPPVLELFMFSMMADGASVGSKLCYG